MCNGFSLLLTAAGTGGRKGGPTHACEMAMIMADPVAKPLITLCERKWVRNPRWSAPAARNIKPAIRLICNTHRLLLMMLLQAQAAFAQGMKIVQQSAQANASGSHLLVCSLDMHQLGAASWVLDSWRLVNHISCPVQFVPLGQSFKGHPVSANPSGPEIQQKGALRP